MSWGVAIPKPSKEKKSCITDFSERLLCCCFVLLESYATTRKLQVVLRYYPKSVLSFSLTPESLRTSAGQRLIAVASQRCCVDTVSGPHQLRVTQERPQLRLRGGDTRSLGEVGGGRCKTQDLTPRRDFSSVHLPWRPRCYTGPSPGRACVRRTVA